jgi:uncharacterized repeat protein (TIGR01451 family)
VLDSPPSRLYDVTDPANPVLVRSLGFGVTNLWAKVNNGNTIAFIAHDQKLHIVDTATLLAGGGGTIVAEPASSSWADVTSDGTAFYAAANGPSMTLERVVSGPSGITTNIIDAAPGFVGRIGYGAGYLIIIGQSGPPASRLLLAYRVGATPIVKSDASTYFRANYNSSFVFLGLFAPVVYARQGPTYLVLPLVGLGDVYELAPAFAATDLSPNTSAPAVVVRGASFDYTFSAINSGTSGASNVVVNIALPPNVTVGSITPAAGFLCSAASGSLICTAPSLAAGATSTFRVTATAPNATGQIQSTINVSADNPDANPANNSSTITIAVVSPEAIPVFSRVMQLLLLLALTSIGALALMSAG